MDAADTRASPEKEEVICMRSITVQRLAEFTEQDYEFTFGITRKEFAQMLEALNAAIARNTGAGRILPRSQCRISWC